MRALREWMVRVQAELANSRERGASALEWALIAAVVVVAAALIGSAVYNVVVDKAAQVENCGNLGPGGTC